VPQHRPAAPSGELWDGVSPAWQGAEWKSNNAALPRRLTVEATATASGRQGQHGRHGENDL